MRHGISIEPIIQNNLPECDPAAGGEFLAELCGIYFPTPTWLSIE